MYPQSYLLRIFCHIIENKGRDLLVLGVEGSLCRLQPALASVELFVAAVAAELPLGVELDDLVPVVAGVTARQTDAGSCRPGTARQAGVERLTGHVT